MIVLNSFICYATDAFSVIFKLNNFFIRCTLLFADSFSYIPNKAFIRFAVVFSFTTLCATDLNRVNLITPRTCLSRSAHSSAFILSSFFSLKEANAISSHRDNLQSSNTQSLCYQTFLFHTPFLLPLPLLPLKPNPRL